MYWIVSYVPRKAYKTTLGKRENEKKKQSLKEKVRVKYILNVIYKNNKSSRFYE